MKTIIMVSALLLLTIQARAGNSVGGTIEKMVGDWTVDTSNIEDLRGEKPYPSLPCRPRNRIRAGNTFRLRDYIEPKDTDFVKAGTRTVILEEFWGGDDQSDTWHRAIDGSAFYEVDNGSRTKWIPPFSRITHNTWFDKQYSVLVHEVSGSLGWSRNTLHLDSIKDQLIYESQYSTVLSERCVFSRVKP